jgi:hypothetical protein
MPLFVVERELPGITEEALMSAGLRAKTCCAEMTAEGNEVRWVRSFFMPDTSRTHCYFEGPSAASIEEANRRARIPFVRISEAAEMTPASL